MRKEKDNSPMVALNLPAAPLRLQQKEGRTMVFDSVRKRYVALTPEEWVRQHFVHFLIEHKHYPEGRIGNEISLRVGDMNKRCDTVIYDRNARPLAIVEYKAPSVAITQRVFDQTWRYNMPLHVPYIIISNGLQHFCCKIDYATNQCKFLQDIPEYSQI